MKKFWLLLLIYNFNASLAANESSQFNFDAIASIGVMSTSGNQFLNEDSGDTIFITENAFRGAYYLNNSVSFTGQMMLRDYGDNYESGAHLDFLQADYTTQLYANSQQTFSLGRFKTKQGFYNATRDVSTTRPSILLPQSVYLDIARNFFLSMDGLRVAGYHQLSNGDLSGEVGIGEHTFDDSFSTMALGRNAKGSWKSGTNKYLDLRFDGENLVLAANVLWLSVEYSPTQDSFSNVKFGENIFQVPLVQGKFDSVMTTLSLRYTHFPIEVTIETNNRDFESSGFSSGANTSKTSMGGEYVQFRYFLNSSLSALFRFDQFLINDDDPKGEELALSGNDASYAYGDTTTIGLNWAIDSNWHLSTEYHWVSGGAWIPPIGKGSLLPDLENDWNISVVQISYIF